MSVVVADLVARVRAEGVQETAAQVKAVGQSAQETARALELMAQAAAKANPSQGSAGQILEVFQKANVQPTAAALAQARAEMEKLAAASTQAVQPSQAVARAARDHVEAATNGARAAQNVAEGWKLSESSLVRFGAGLAGVGLGFSIVAGAARLIHDAVEGIVTRQLDWERSLVTLSGLYGEAGSKAAAFAQAQANLPNVLGTNQEFAQAAINASALTQRYGLPQRVTDQLTTTGGRLAFALGLNTQPEREALQAQLLQSVTSGGQIPQLGIYTDPEAVARRLGAPGAQTLQAYTPREILEARAAITSGSGNAFADQADRNRRGLLTATTNAEKALEVANSNLTGVLENGLGRGVDLSPTSDLAYQQAYGDEQLRQRRAALGLPEVAAPALPGAATVGGPDRTAALQGNAEDSLRALVTAQSAYAQTLADSNKAQEESRLTFERLSRSVDAVGARLLGFTGSLEDQASIGHGDILAQAQASVTARARSAVPLFGMGASEISALAMGDTWQAAWQNYVAAQAQGPQPNAIQRNLQQQADTSRFQTLAPDRQDARISAAVGAQRALDQAAATGPLFEAQRGAQSRAAQVDLDAAQTQAQLDAISLTQRERQVALLRDTIDLRRLDVQQQQAGLHLTEDVIRAQQAAQAPQYALSDANYASQRTQALARQYIGRSLRGQSTAGLPSINDLIQQNVNSQFDIAERTPAALEAGHRVEMAQRTATAAGLSQQLTEGQVRYAELGNDLNNLKDLPSQTALMLEDVQNARESLAVQKEIRDLQKDLVKIFTGRGGPSQSGSSQALDELIGRVALAVLGDDDTGGNIAPPDAPGNRRGPV